MAARVHFDRGLELYRAGEGRAAAVELERAYRLAPVPKAARAVARVWAAAGEPDRGWHIADEHLRCTGDDEELRKERDAIDAASGVLAVGIAGDARQVILRVDEEDVEPERLQRGIRLAPGRHVLSWYRVGSGQGERHELSIAAGQRLEKVLELPVEAPPMLCLSPLPCLEPWPPPPVRERPPLDLVPFVGAQATADPSSVGLSFRVALVGSWNEDVEVAGDAGAGRLWSEDRWIYGTSFVVRFWLTPTFTAGGGVDTALLLGDEEEVQDPDDIIPWSIVAGPMGEVGVAPGPLRISLRVPVWIAAGQNDGERFIDVAPQLLLGVSFADLDALLKPDGNEPALTSALSPR